MPSNLYPLSWQARFKRNQCNSQKWLLLLRKHSQSQHLILPCQPNQFKKLSLADESAAASSPATTGFGSVMPHGSQHPFHAHRGCTPTCAEHNPQHDAVSHHQGFLMASRIFSRSQGNPAGLYGTSGAITAPVPAVPAPFGILGCSV